MNQLTDPNFIWPALFVLSFLFDAIGLLLPASIWLRFGLLAIGTICLLVGILIMGWLQRSE